MISGENFEIQTVLFGINLIANFTSLVIITFFLNTKFSPRLVTQTPQLYFPPWIIETSIDVEYYLDNNFWLTFHYFLEKIWNPDSTIMKMTILQDVPVLQFFSAQDYVHSLVTSLQNGIFSFPSTVEIFNDVEHNLENNIWFILHNSAK